MSNTETTETATATEATTTEDTKSTNPIQEIINRAEVEGATAHHVIADLIAAIQQLSVRAQISVGIAQKIFFKETEGLKGQIQALIQHADEETLKLTHELLGSRVTIPEPENKETTNNETNETTNDAPANNVIDIASASVNSAPATNNQSGEEGK